MAISKLLLTVTGPIFTKLASMLDLVILMNFTALNAETEPLLSDVG